MSGQEGDQIRKGILIAEVNLKEGADHSPSRETPRTTRVVLCVVKRTIGREIALRGCITRLLEPQT